MPGGADGKRVSRRRAFPKRPNGTAWEELPRAEHRRTKPDGCAHGQSEPPEFLAALRDTAAFVLPVAAASPVRCCLACVRTLTRMPPLYILCHRLACVPPLCQCTAVFACVRTAALLVCLRFSFVPPPCLCAAGTYCPLKQRASPAAFPENPYAASRKFGREQVRKGETWAAQNFLSFLKKRLAFSKIIGYNNQALERDAKKQNMDD